MTPSDGEILRTSFAKVALMPEVAGALFYERLFTINPDYRALFKHDMRVQGMKLMTMLAVIVYGDPDETMQAIQDMGQRHTDYGVKASDYDAVCKSLLWMLEQLLGETFTPAIRDAWIACYDDLARQMKAASQG